MADITRFFRALSERAYKENNLSDATYAMCEADVKFKQYFLDFFFHDAYLDANDVKIEREHTDKLGRPDFWIERKSDGQHFIVEVKIWDGNHHFEQYYDILSGALNPNTSSNIAIRDDMAVWHRLGYIANYESVKNVQVEGTGKVAKEICHVFTWKDFIGELEDKLEHAPCAVDPVCMAYVEYVKRVCPFDDFEVGDNWKIDISDFKAIQSFEENVKGAIADSNMGCSLYTTRRKFRSQQWMGQYFEWMLGGDKKVWGWLGAYYKDNGAVVCVEFEDVPGWGKVICEQYANLVHDGYLRFCSEQSDKIALDKKGLTDFFNGVLQLLLTDNAIPTDNKSFCTNLDDAQSNVSEKLLSMKCLPFVIENYLVTEEFKCEIVSRGYEFAIVHGSDEEVPESHCGRYFELRRSKKTDASKDNTGSADEEKLPAYRGWIGVDYNANCHRLNKDGSKGTSYQDNPSFVIEIAKDFPGAAELYENSWGWKCYEITTDVMPYSMAMHKVQQQLLNMCAKSNVAE